MDKKTVMKFLEKIGFKVNSEEALEEIQTNGQNAGAPPEGDGEEGRQTVRIHSANAPTIELPENVAQFDALVEELGGFSQFAGLLLNAAELQQAALESAESKREALIASLVENSDGSITKEELEEVDTKALELMANVITPQVDYSVRGLRSNSGGEKDDGYIEAPSFFLAKNKKED